MIRYRTSVLIAIWIACVGLQGLAPSHADPAATSSFAVRNVDVFDGRQRRPAMTVIVRNGYIEAVGAGLAVPEGLSTIDGEGMTLLPGLIDSHVHYLAPRNLEQALAFGITTEMEMGSDPALVAAAHRRQAEAGWAGEADIFTAGSLLTAPGGHGTEYGLELTTISGPEQAEARIAERVRRGADYIKIVLDDGHTYRSLPTISEATLRSIIAAAHRRDRQAVVHIGSAREADRVIRAGADALAHLFVDAPPPDGFAARAAANGIFVVPTMVVMERIVDEFDRGALLSDPRLRPYLSPSDAAALRRRFPIRAAVPVSLSFAQDSVRQLRDAGVPILAGSDSGVTHGPLLHRELALLVEAGLSPLEALAAATSVPAAQFGMDDRGEIRPGQRADLLLVRGDPTRDITALRDIAYVWKRGRLAGRARFAAALQAERAVDDRLRAAPPPAGSESGLVSGFENGLGSEFGAGWSEYSDQVAGGASTATLSVSEGGARGSGHALRVEGEIRPGFPFGFAGATFMPGPRPYQPANLASRRLSFWARGDGQTYGVLVSARSYGRLPAKISFVATPGWTHYSFPLSDFDGMEGHDVTAIAFSSGPEHGRFAFELDDIRLEPAG